MTDYEWQSWGYVFTPVAFAAAGWRYLAAAESDTTVQASPDLDDTAWTVAPAPFGTVPAASGVGSGALGWPAPATAVPTSVTLWLRRQVRAVPATTLSIGLRYDGAAAVYWNGRLVLDLAETSSLTAGITVQIPAGQVDAENLLAVRVRDDAGDPTSDYTYADVSVSEV